MMVETILESTQDFGMSNGALPQWKRELLQRRAARSRPPAPAAPAPPPPPPPVPSRDDDEELRYGPGIVKRLKSRYLSLALRDAPRRRPSVLRRAASLEHLLDERPPAPPRAPPALARPPRPASLAAPPALASLAARAPRRDSVKRARSVDALSRLEARDEPQPPSPSPPPPPPAPRPPQPRAARPPRRPAPLLRETERPPPDVVRSTLRKFETAPPRRTAPAARVSAVLRGLEGARSPSPPAPSEQAEPAEAPGPRPVSQAALEGIARAGSTVRYAFEAPLAGSHLPPLAATNAVLVGRARRVGVIRPMPPPERAPSPPPEPPPVDITEKIPDSPPAEVVSSPAPDAEPPPARVERREPPPSALVEPIPRNPEFTGLESPRPFTPVERVPSPEASPAPEPKAAPGPKPSPRPKPILEPNVTSEPKLERTPSPEIKRAPELVLTPEIKLAPELKLISEPFQTRELIQTRELSSTPERKQIPEVKQAPELISNSEQKPIPQIKSFPELKPVVEIQPVIEPKPAGEPDLTPKTSPILIPKLKSIELKKTPEGGSKPATPLLNGHAVPDCKVSSVVSRIGAAGIERAWSGSADRKPAAAPQANGLAPAAAPGGPSPAPAWARGSPAAPRRPRAPPPATANSVVFNFSNRKEVPDYIENDGLILRANRRNRFKAGEAGVVVLRGAGGGGGGQETHEDPPSEEDEADGTEERVTFLNDNVLINGRSSMPARPDRERIAKLKLQFDDSLTRTFEYPSETSFCEESPGSPPPGAPASTPASTPPSTPASTPPSTPASTPPSTPNPEHQLAEPAVMAPLAANTHLASAALSRYTPSKTPPAVFQLGLTSHQHHQHQPHQGESGESSEGTEGVGAGQGEAEEGASERDGACATRPWSEARTHRTDLLF